MRRWHTEICALIWRMSKGSVVASGPGGDPSWSTDSSTKIPSLLWKGDGEGREDVDVVWALWGLWRMKTVGS